jgi:hypothetical protein
MGREPPFRQLSDSYSLNDRVMPVGSTDRCLCDPSGLLLSATVKTGHELPFPNRLGTATMPHKLPFTPIY